MIQGRPAQPASRRWNLFKAIVGMGLFWSVFLFAVPGFLYLMEFVLGLDAFHFGGSGVIYGGLLLFLAGTSLAAAGCWYLVTAGEGTPAPFDCPRKLVTTGPYHYVRNPMTLAGITQGYALGLMLGSPVILIYAALGLLLTELLRPWEEADLDERFGQDYREYKKEVLVWLPRTGMRLSRDRRGPISAAEGAYWDKTGPPSSLTQAAGLPLSLQSIQLGPDPEDSAESLMRRALDALFAYRIFPESKMRAKVCTRDGKIAEGALILQHIFVGRWTIEAAVRVLEVFDHEKNGQRIAGFRYAALPGHPETGVATFTLHQNRQSGRVTLSIEARSRPGNWLLRGLAPMTRAVQRNYTREALREFQILVAVRPGPKVPRHL